MLEKNSEDVSELTQRGCLQRWDETMTFTLRRAEEESDAKLWVDREEEGLSKTFLEIKPRNPTQQCSGRPKCPEESLPKTSSSV